MSGRQSMNKDWGLPLVLSSYAWLTTIPTHARIPRDTIKSMSNPAPVVRAPHGRDISCKGWHQEGALRMLMNNLDPQVAERPDELIVYGGNPHAARDSSAVPAIVRSPPPPAYAAT